MRPGRRWCSGRWPRRVIALVEFGRWLDEQRAQDIELWAAIERPDGSVVDLLLDHGVVVYPINPKALDQIDFGRRVILDAWLQPSSEAAQELKLLTRDCQRLVRASRRGCGIN